MKKLVYILFILILPFFAFTQQKLEGGAGYLVHAKVIDGDTLPHINLRQVYIVPMREFTSEKERRRYTKLVRDLKKVLPYARMAQKTFMEINDELPKYKNKKAKKKFIKKKDKELKAKYEGKLRKLTIRQGRLLIKLIDREIGENTYTVIKELKGSFSAFMWQTVARLFGSNLKSEYEAKTEDKYIEEIIILIDNGQI